ncbi:MAG: hypothetical protein AB7O97_11345 [Planctomycetota bacterium]
MANHRGNADESRRAWLARIVVWCAFAIVAWAFGPRALAVLQSRVEGAARNTPMVEFDKVGFLRRPDWMSDDLLVAVSRDLQPWLVGAAPILDDAEAKRLLAGLATVPWVAETRLERVFPDRFRIAFGLRRPVLAVRDELGRPLCLCDVAGTALPWVDGSDVPQVVLRREGGPGTVRGGLGEVVPDERVVAAAAIAVQWRDELAPLVPGCPRLLEVDTTNLGLRWVRSPEYPEVRVMLARDDGAPVVFGYGRPVDAPLPCVPIETKAKVLRAVLDEHPRLGGLVAGDLRFELRWRSWLQPRQGS